MLASWISRYLDGMSRHPWLAHTYNKQSYSLFIISYPSYRTNLATRTPPSLIENSKTMPERHCIGRVYLYTPYRAYILSMSGQEFPTVNTWFLGSSDCAITNH